ncbi:MAG: ATP-binding cassette domain-containing protein [Pseudomonadota bacterium]
MRRPPFMEVLQLSAWYGGVQALDQVSIELMPQEILGLAGAPKSGRTTLMHCLCRPMDTHSRLRVVGQILMRGRSVIRNHWRNDEYRNRFAWVGDRTSGFAGSVHDVCLSRIPEHMKTGGTLALSEHVKACLDMVQLLEDLPGAPEDVSALELTPGQRLQLDLARAIASQPDVLLVDLRTPPPDAKAMRTVEETLLALRLKMPVVLASDDAHQMLRICDRVACLQNGRLAEVGPAVWMARNPTTREARRVFSKITSVA